LQALVSQLVARIEHLSQDVTTFDSTRQLKEDNLLLRKDLQVKQKYLNIPGRAQTADQ
jgi:hypothetical protein